MGRGLPDLHVLLRTTLPHQFLKENLTLSWELHPSIQDIGCVQNGPLLIDVEKTWIEYERFHIEWSRKVCAEAELIRSYQPDLVISNISYFGVEAGAQSGIPTVAMGSLSWDGVLEYFRTPDSDVHRHIIDQIRQSYRKAQLMIRFAPAIPMVAFSDLVDVGPIAGPLPQSTGTVRELLQVKPQEKIVLVAFGGIPLSSLPVEYFEGLQGYRFLVDGFPDLGKLPHLNSINTLSVPFRQILAEADLIITKPGYATIIEAVRNTIPVIYVRRYNFLDEQPLVDYLHRYGQGRELHIDHFHKGEWLEALEAVQQIPLPTERPPELGTRSAAEELVKLF